MTYVSDPSTPSGWRFEWDAPIAQFIPELDAAGNPTGALIPTISRTPDGRPIATTPEQVAALHELVSAEPPTMSDRMRQFQIEAAIASANKAGEDAELRAEFDMIARLDPRVAGSEIAEMPDEPATIAERNARVNAVGQLAATLGYGVRVDVHADLVADQSGVPFMREKTDVCLLNSNGSIAYGPASLAQIEVRLATDLRQKAAEQRREQLHAEHAERQRAEAAARRAGSPEGRLAELQRQVAELTGKPAPAAHIPSRMGVALIEVNDIPVGEVPL